MALVVRELTKIYAQQHKALDRVSFGCGSTTCGLLGPNGAGKTTLMRILTTMLEPTSGDAFIDGVTIRDRRAIRQMVGYLPQSFGFYPQLTVRETIEYFVQLKEASRQRAGELLELVGLADRRSTRVSGLSGGMKQRLGIAVALLNDPQFLVVDEPTAGLDPEGRIEFRKLLTTLPGNRTILLSTHIADDVAQSAAELVVLYQGVVIFQGTPGALAKSAEGRVWHTELPVSDLRELEQTHLVTATVRSGNSLQVRCIGPGGAGMRPLPATLEDGYMLLLKGVRAS